MIWLKRNLMMVIGGVVTLAILGFGGFYTYSNINQNDEVDAQLSATLGSLTNIYRQVPFPHKTNIDAAVRELGRMNAELAKLQARFSPPPAENVSGLRFRTLLENTVADLRRQAVSIGVGFGKTNFYFAFDSLRQKADYSPGSFPIFPEQLADIKALCFVLFESRIAELSSIRRARVSSDDVVGAPEYHDLRVSTNAAANAAVHPYEVSFVCLSESFAQVLRNFEKSPNGFLVKAVHVDSIGGPVNDAGMKAAQAILPGQTGPPPPGPLPGARPPPPGRTGPPRPRAIASGASYNAADDALPLILKEKQFRVTLLVEAIKPLKS